MFYDESMDLGGNVSGMRKRVDVFLFSLTDSVHKLRVNSELAKMTAFQVSVMSEPVPFLHCIPDVEVGR